jgi:hypothetical protein
MRWLQLTGLLVVRQVRGTHHRALTSSVSVRFRQRRLQLNVKIFWGKNFGNLKFLFVRFWAGRKGAESRSLNAGWVPEKTFQKRSSFVPKTADKQYQPVTTRKRKSPEIRASSHSVSLLVFASLARCSGSNPLAASR